ncbi:hypothetical protein DL93DRAFT_2081254 [Clavulina sp. PMI_390]|nr:hypothetical protein DL93DRAFT_2081254 [Clavulina sp. PMI_390]
MSKDPSSFPLVHSTTGSVHGLWHTPTARRNRPRVPHPQQRINLSSNEPIVPSAPHNTPSENGSSSSTTPLPFPYHVPPTSTFPPAIAGPSKSSQTSNNSASTVSTTIPPNTARTYWSATNGAIVPAEYWDEAVHTQNETEPQTSITATSSNAADDETSGQDDASGSSSLLAASSQTSPSPQPRAQRRRWTRRWSPNYEGYQPRYF